MQKSEINPLAENMMETLKKQGGIGLAAPQVGWLKNLFVIDTTPFENEGVEKLEKVFINPEICEMSTDTDYFNEGCLSIPGIFEEVKRPEKVAVRYQDIDSKWQEEELSGITSRIFQHEYDHLQGILFIDRISNLRKKTLHKKLFYIVRKNKPTV